MQPTARIAILKAGKFTAVDGREVTVTPEILQELAEGYDPKTSDAPLVVGHPNVDAPAYGWTSELRLQDGVLFAEPRQVEPQFAEMVNAGRFKNVSASYYTPTTPGNPKPGKHYLKHIGFLGAAAPAVKGLPQVQFAEGGDAIELSSPLGYAGSVLGDLFQRIREYFVERDGVEKADAIIPQWQISSLREIGAESEATAPSFAAPSGSETETDMSDKAALEALQATLNNQSAALDARDQELRTREQQALRIDLAAFADGLVTEGKLLPRMRDRIVEVLVSLPADLAVSFAEGEATVTKPTRDVLRGILSDMPKIIDYREKSAGETAAAPVAFASPAGIQVDAARLEIHHKAVAHQAAHPNTAYLDAVKAVGG